MQYFYWDNQALSLEELLGLDTQASSFLGDVITFLKLWLDGQEVFDIQTSGTTGPPKKIQATRGQLTASASLTKEVLQLEEDSTALMCLSPQHIAGKMMLVRALVNQWNLILVEPSSNPFLNIPQNVNIDFVALVPLQLRQSVRESLKQINAVKMILIGGAPISKSLLDQIKILDAQVFESYGMSETVSHIALRQLNGTSPQANFQTLPEVKIGVDHRDCLHVSHPQITAGKIIQTNDIVDLRSSNTFNWLGRADFAINSGGIKLHPEQIEAKISAFLKPPTQYFISSIPDESLGQKVILIIEGKSWPEQDVDQLLSSINQKTNRYERIHLVKFLPKFNYKVSGKFDRLGTLSNLS